MQTEDPKEEEYYETQEIILPAPQKNSFWRKLGGGSLTISIIVHAILLALAAIWIIRIIPPPEEKTVDFMPSGGGGGSPAAQERSMQKQKASVMKPNASRISVQGVASNISLPEMDSSSQLSSLGSLSGGMSGGLGGTGSGGGRGDGFGKGFGSGTGPGSGLGSGTVNPFGMSQGEGLVGNFYDFKRDQANRPTDVKAMDRQAYKKIVEDFAKGTSWEPSKKHKYFRSASTLTSKAIAFKGIRDTEAGQAFRSPETTAGAWVAHYSGDVTPTESGRYTFIGWGDNNLIMGINGRIVLDASDTNYTEQKRDSLGEINIEGKPQAGLFSGNSVQLVRGKTVRLDILIGDEGGIFSAGIMILKEGEEMKRGKGNVPLLPILTVARLSDGEKKLYDFLPPEAVASPPLFEAKRSAF